mmetsp:Transcript_48836/g.105254  ORF Transcript_48836/g.105254 Transcript_48836/m.105254 type:complete len:277 (+) Transcript_48836:169-999(+)
MQMPSFDFVPGFPLLASALVFAGVTGGPSLLRALWLSGGTLRSKMSIWHGVGLTITIAALTLKKGNNLFAWHVIGMCVGILIFQPAALHSILARHSFKDADTRKARTFDHKLLQTAVVISVTVGFLAIFFNKPAGFPGKHFMSVHSLVGATALGFMALNMLDAMYRQGANPLKPKLTWVSNLHRSTGTIAFVLALVAIMLGLYNRTPVVDWAVQPIQFSLPSSWYQMDGWSKNTHGEMLTWLFIVSALVLLLNMLSPGAIRSPPLRRGERLEKKTT